jgi:L-asparaginase
VSLLLIATGGTIASKVQPDGGVATALDGRELLATVPDLDASGVDVAGIDVMDLFQGPSWNLDLEAMSAIARAARDASVDGVVITHGTDTLEETAYLTHLVAGAATTHKPIVVTGSMRNAGEANGDGAPNLRDAFAVARSRDAVRRGAVVVVNGEIHSARWATKTDTQAVETFRSPGHGPIGRVVAARVEFSEPAPSSQTAAAVDAGAHVTDGPIAIVPSYGDVDPGLVDWHLDRSVRGVVIEGSGAGNVHSALVSGIEHARDRDIPVVITSRCLTGSVAPIYGGPGGGHSIAALGVVNGGDLSARKARLALAVGLAVAPDRDLHRWFASLVG